MKPINKSLILFIKSFFLFLTVEAQELDLEKIKWFYQNLEEQQKGNTPFIQSSMNLLEDTDGVKQIILVRHGKPYISRDGWFNRKEAKKFIKDYDSVGIYPPAYQPLLLNSGEIDKVYTSNLNRAIHTTKLITGDSISIIQREEFAEFERKIISFFNIKMPLGFWLINSRLFWVLGLNDKGIENFKQAKKRAKEGALFLAEEAEKDGKVVLVAHGFLNKYLRKYLKKQGWELVKDGGQEHLGVSLLIKAE